MAAFMNAKMNCWGITNGMQDRKKPLHGRKNGAYNMHPVRRRDACCMPR